MTEPQDDRQDERHEAEAPETRDRYAHLSTIDTRWGDNDMYGHVSNVVYYSYVDRETWRPVPVPDHVRAALEELRGGE